MSTANEIFLKNISQADKDIKIKITDDKMIAYVPAFEPFSDIFFKWDLKKFQSYLKTLNLISEITEDDFIMLRKLAEKNQKGLSDNFNLLKGIFPVPPVFASLQWLNEAPVPEDLVQKNKAFLKILAPIPAQPGINVFGTVVEDKDADAILEPIILHLPNCMIIKDNGLVISNLSGQAVIKGNNLEFNTQYIINDPSLPKYKIAEFYANVNVKTDLVVDINWKIYGNLVVDGHLESPNIEVHGDTYVNHGIQTNKNGILRFYGNLRTSYIQFSKIGVEKNLIIDTSIVQSEIRVAGDITCQGEPGAIIGSEIVGYGNLIANRIGSDKGKKTKIKIRKHPDNINKISKIKIGKIATGTRMQIYHNTWTQAIEESYEYTGSN